MIKNKAARAKFISWVSFEISSMHANCNDLEKAKSPKLDQDKISEMQISLYRLTDILDAVKLGEIS